VLCGLHAAQLRRTPALVLFVPLVILLAEVMATQAVALALAAHATGRGNLLRNLGKEALLGVVLALACGVVTGGLAMAVWAVPNRFALGLGGTVAAAGVVAVAGGLALPVLLRRLRWDARVAAGPPVRALVSVAALALYFGLARWLLG
jgi:magnesium transporter